MSAAHAAQASILALIACALTPPASAQQAGAEQTANGILRGGYAWIDFDEWGAADPSGNALLFSIAYQVQPWLELELGWLNASRVSGEVIATPFTIRPDERTLEARAMTFGPRITHRFDSGLSVYGTAGYAYTSHYYRLVGGTFATPDFTTGETRHDDEIFYGAGIGYELHPNFGVQLDYRRMEFSELPMDSIGLMFSYRFDVF